VETRCPRMIAHLLWAAWAAEIAGSGILGMLVSSRRWQHIK
jgi:hypothetical protein